MGDTFHPSMFDKTNGDTAVLRKDDRTMYRGYKFDENIKLKGTRNIEMSDNDISKSNTKHLFKNLYGETPLTFLFFSEKNIDNVQDLIKFIVHRETNQVIDKQSNQELLIVMRSIFLEYSSHPRLFKKDMNEDDKKKLLTEYKNEVSRLNEIVLNSIVPKIVSQMQQYITYLKDASTPQYQMEIPKSDTIIGERENRSITQVLMGGEL